MRTGSSSAVGGLVVGERGLKERLREIGERLAARYGRPDRCAHEGDPLRNLVLTILSQNTTDANRDRAFATLTDRYPAMADLAAAKPREVEEAIRVGGLARAKAKAILTLLSRLKEERGGYDLGFLAPMPLDAARRYLVSFPGVGVKTANVVLLFSFRKEAFPVDTHILRVSRRLGLVPAAAELGRAAAHLEPHVAPGEQVSLHLNLIRLGREICRPRNPRHADCPLLPLCPEGLRALGRAPDRSRSDAGSADRRRPGDLRAPATGGRGGAGRGAPKRGARKARSRGKAPPRRLRP